MLKLDLQSIPQLQLHATQGIQPSEHQLGEGTETDKKTKLECYTYFMGTSRKPAALS